MPPPATPDRWIATFLDALAAERDSAANTRLAYGRDLLDFAGWTAAQGTSFATIDRAGIEGYLVSLDAAGLSQATRARRLSALRQFFAFAFDEGWRPDNPALRIAGRGARSACPRPFPPTKSPASSPPRAKPAGPGTTGSAAPP